MDFQNSFCLTYAVRRCNPSYAKELVRLLSKRPRTSYAVGDVVGVKVSRIDRSEMDDRILPCKVREHIAEADIDRVQCVHSIISNTYSAAALVDLTNATWPELEGLDMTASHTAITSVRAALQASSSVNSDHGVVCQCKGVCAKRECVCKVAGVPCSSSCHTDNPKCRNKD